MRFWRCLPLVFVLSAVFGCGGGGGGGSSSAGGVIAGIVTDGSIEGARVTLRDALGGVVESCGASGTGRCETLSDASGAFRFDIDPSVSLNTLTAVATGGRDAETGVDFTGIDMYAPLRLFDGRENRVVISPLTSLVTARIDSGADLETALAETAIILPTLTTEDLVSSPSGNPVAQRLSLFLSALALEMTDLPDPFARMKDLPVQPLSETPGDLPSAPLDALLIDADAQLRLTELYEVLFAEAVDPARAFSVEFLFQAVREVLAEVTPSPESFNPDDPLFIANAHALAEAIQTASEPDPVPLGGVVPRRLARYVLWSYALGSFDDFLHLREDFLILLTRQTDGQLLSTDPEIGRLAALASQYSVEVPLTPVELSGDDNLLRARYYFASDASRFYKAEQLLFTARDDQIADPVLVEIARRKGEYGFLEEAVTLIETSISQPNYKADAYRKLGSAYFSYGRTDEALTLFSKAEELNDFIIASKGIASIDADDVERLQYLADAYRRAGSIDGAQRVLATMEEALPYLGTVVAFGRVITPTKNIVDQYIEEGKTESALAVLESLYAFALETPPNVIEFNGAIYRFFQGRVVYLIDAAQRYADLGMSDRVLEIYDIIKGLRADDGLQNLTMNETWYQATLLVEILYSAGLQAEAYSLAETIPATYTNYAGSVRNNTLFQKRAFKSIAADEAVRNGLPAALSFIESKLTTTTDKIEALTYYATNTRVPFVALALVRDGQPAVARDALALATTYVDTLVYTKDLDIRTYKIRLGYAKIANLYTLAGDPIGAQAVLAKAEAAAGDMSLSSYRIDALLDIAVAYASAGNGPQASLFLSAASTGAQSLLPTLSAEEGFYLLKAVADTAFTLGNESLALELIDLCRMTAGLIFDGSLPYLGTEHDDLAGDEVDLLIETAHLYLRGGDESSAIQTVLEAKDVADQIWVEEIRLGRYINDEGKPNIVEALAEMGDFDRALEITQALPYLYDRNLGLQTVARVYAFQNDFPLQGVADVDTDHDGMPDFFNPLATALEITQSGLRLDDDSDGDGIPDSSDLRPLCGDESSDFFR